MKKMLLVVRREYLDRVKKKSFLIGTILGPVLMGLMIFAPALIFRLSPDTQTTVSVVDLTGVVYEQMEASLTDTLDSGELKFSLREHKAEEIGLDEAKRVLNLEVEEDAIDGYLVIPADIIESGKATYYGKRVGDIKSNDNLERALSKVIIGMRLSSEGLEYSKVKGLVENVNLETMQVTEDGAEKRGGFDFVFMSSFLFIMMLYMTILMWGVAVQRSIIEEKNNRVIEVLLSSLRPEDLLFGKIFGVGAVGMTQYAIWGLFGTIMTAYGLTMGGPVAELAGNFSFATLGFFILYYLLGFLFYATRDDVRRDRIGVQHRPGGAADADTCRPLSRLHDTSADARDPEARQHIRDCDQPDPVLHADSDVHEDKCADAARMADSAQYSDDGPRDKVLRDAGGKDIPDRHPDVRQEAGRARDPQVAEEVIGWICHNSCWIFRIRVGLFSMRLKQLRGERPQGGDVHGMRHNHDLPV